MIRNILLGVFATAATVFGTLYVYNLAQPEPVHPVFTAGPAADDGRIAALEKRLADQDAELKQLRTLLDADRKKLREMKDADEAMALMSASSKKSAAAPPPVMTNNPLGQIFQAVGAMFTNPATMKAMSRGMRGSMRSRDHLYDAFIAKAGLNEEQARTFRRLLHKKQMAKFGRGWMGGEEADAQTKEADDELKNLLGSNYGAYLAYENQIPARNFVDSFAASMEDSDGANLSSQTREALVTAIAAIPGMSQDEQMKSFQAGFKPGQPIDPNKMFDRQMDKTMEHYDQIVAASKPILTPAENAALDEYLGEKIAQQEMGANVAKAIIPAIFGTNGIPNFIAPGGQASGAVSVEAGPAP